MAMLFKKREFKNKNITRTLTMNRTGEKKSLSSQFMLINKELYEKKNKAVKTKYVHLAHCFHWISFCSSWTYIDVIQNVHYLLTNTHNVHSTIANKLKEITMNGERRKDSELGQSIKWEKANVWICCLLRVHSKESNESGE